MSNVFGLDIGTRNVVGTVGYRTEDEKFTVIAQYIKQHETRAMLDGQIHDIGRVARTVSAVKAELEREELEDTTEFAVDAPPKGVETEDIPEEPAEEQDDLEKTAVHHIDFGDLQFGRDYEIK